MISICGVGGGVGEAGVGGGGGAKGVGNSNTSIVDSVLAGTNKEPETVVGSLSEFKEFEIEVSAFIINEFRFDNDLDGVFSVFFVSVFIVS